MSIEGLGITLGLLIVFGLWIAAPLLSRRASRANETAERQRERLAVHYDRLLTNIRDLDEDYATGKIDAENYEFERERMMQSAMRLLMESDAVGGMPIPAGTSATGRAPITEPSEGEIDAAIDERIEQAVAAYRKAKSQAH